MAKKGSHLSEETKRKISEAQKGRKQSKETIAKKLGRKHTPESIQKMRDSHRGFKLSPESLRKILETRKGYVPSQETRDKIRKTLTGRKQSEELKIKRGIYRSGSENSNWKGGISISRYGYVFIYSPNHPNKSNRGYVMQHRLVVESYFGRYLTKEETVHHINGDRSDNRIINLILFKCSGDHTRFHKLIRTWERENNVNRKNT
jgi:uncharacterized protein (DUF1330 family)